MTRDEFDDALCEKLLDLGVHALASMLLTLAYDGMCELFKQEIITEWEAQFGKDGPD